MSYKGGKVAPPPTYIHTPRPCGDAEWYDAEIVNIHGSPRERVYLVRYDDGGEYKQHRLDHQAEARTRTQSATAPPHTHPLASVAGVDTP